MMVPDTHPASECQPTWSPILNPSAMSRTPRFLQKDVLQYDRIVVFFIVRTVDKGNRFGLRKSANALKLLGMMPQFAPVAALKFYPAPRIMTEPLPQFGTRGDVLHPVIKSGFCLAHPARPKPINQKPYAIPGLSRLISALQPKMRDRKRRLCHADSFSRSPERQALWSNTTATSPWGQGSALHPHEKRERQ